MDMEETLKKVQTRFADQTRTGQVDIIRSDSTQAFSALPDNSLDFVYIDGDHNEPAVYSDLIQSARVLKPGGRIGLDDYTLGGWWNRGVTSALARFLCVNRDDFVLDLKIGDQVVVLKK